jgi:hypothetical protein
MPLGLHFVKVETKQKVEERRNEGLPDPIGELPR